MVSLCNVSAKKVGLEKTPETLLPLGIDGACHNKKKGRQKCQLTHVGFVFDYSSRASTKFSMTMLTKRDDSTSLAYIKYWRGQEIPVPYVLSTRMRMSFSPLVVDWHQRFLFMPDSAERRRTDSLLLRHYNFAAWRQCSSWRRYRLPDDFNQLKLLMLIDGSSLIISSMYENKMTPKQRIDNCWHSAILLKTNAGKTIIR